MAENSNVCLWLLTALTTFILWSYWFLRQKYSVWSSQGIPGTRPFPFLGDLPLRLTSVFHQLDIDLVAKYGPIHGSYTALKPVLTVADPVLIKQVLIGDFPNFINRTSVKATFHPLWDTNLLFSHGEQWRKIRSIVTPTFTTAKLRSMVPLMNRCTEQLIDSLTILTQKKGARMDTKALISGFSMDIIASSLYATETNCNLEGSSSLEAPSFVAMGKAMFAVPLHRAIPFMMLPKWINDLLGIDQPFNREAFAFFTQLSRHIVRERRSNGVRKADLVQMLLDASVEEAQLQAKIDYGALQAIVESSTTENKPDRPQSTAGQKKLSDDEIVANCMFFFLAGYETTSSTLSHCLFELSQNPEAQTRLHDILQDALAPFAGHVNSTEYLETLLNRIPYLDAVINETLRMYPPITLHSRVCGTDGYKLGPATLQKGYMVSIPVTAVHFNPQNYPEPYSFKPERFLPGAEPTLKAYTFIPFGLGPRNCVGMRFALQEIKLCLAQILLRFTFRPAPETPPKLSFKRGNALLSSESFQLIVSVR